MSRFGMTRCASMSSRSNCSAWGPALASSFSGTSVPSKTAATSASISSLVRIFSIEGILLHHEVSEVNLGHLAGGDDLVHRCQDLLPELVLPLQVLDLLHGLGGEQDQDGVTKRRHLGVQFGLCLSVRQFELHLELQVADLLAVVDVHDERLQRVTGCH